MRKRTFAWSWLAAWPLLALGQGPAAARGDDFFPAAHWLMSKPEREIYAHLADDAARGEFIRDFWEKRDPTPGTPENEFRDDFQRRAEFAERWFREPGGTGGWESDRGRILLTLGFPDERQQLPMLDRPRARAAEAWTYTALMLRIEFIDRDGLGRFRLEEWPLELLDAVERARQQGGPPAAGSLRFRARRRDDGLLIEIPVKGVTVEESGPGVRAAFAVRVDVFRDYAKKERIELSREFVETRAALARRRAFAIVVPYPLAVPGDYWLDVTVTEESTGARWRDGLRLRKRR